MTVPPGLVVFQGTAWAALFGCLCIGQGEDGAIRVAVLSDGQVIKFTEADGRRLQHKDRSPHYKPAEKMAGAAAAALRAQGKTQAETAVALGVSAHAVWKNLKRYDQAVASGTDRPR